MRATRSVFNLLFCANLLVIMTCIASIGLIAITGVISFDKHTIPNLIVIAASIEWFIVCVICIICCLELCIIYRLWDPDIKNQRTLIIEDIEIDAYIIMHYIVLGLMIAYGIIVISIHKINKRFPTYFMLAHISTLIICCTILCISFWSHYLLKRASMRCYTLI